MRAIGARTVLILCSALFATASFAQETPSEVSDAQISVLKSGVHSGCEKRGLERGDDRAAVEGFCACMSTKLDESVTRADWQQLYWLESHRQQDQDQEQALLGKYLPALQVCKGK